MKVDQTREAVTMKVAEKRRWKILWVAGATMALVAGMVSTVPSAYAGGTIKDDTDKDKYIDIGMGIRTSFNATENGAPNGSDYDNTFMVNNARIYINGGIHKYLKFTFNTECFNCGSQNGRFGGTNTFAGNSNIGLIDAIGKFEFQETVNFWVGRTLVPTERGELNGPFYHALFDGFRTPFFPSDQSANFGRSNAGNDGAGLYGRDDGAVFFGKIHPGGTHLLYVASVFTGQNGGPNTGASPLYAGRLQWNLLNDENNPGYYTSGTYYGTAGDILALAVGGSHQKDGVGTAITKNDFNGLVTDLLFEKVLPDKGVFTFNAEFKRFWAQNVNSFTDGTLAGGTGATTPCGCSLPGSANSPSPGMWVLNGHSWTLYGLYLMPQQIGIGRFQPYVRFTYIAPLDSSQRDEWELGTNYVIAGHNARISAYWRYGDITTKGFVGGPGVYAPNRQGDEVSSFHLALQMQY